MCIYLLKIKGKWYCKAFWMQTGRECAKKNWKRRVKGMNRSVEVCDA